MKKKLKVHGRVPFMLLGLCVFVLGGPLAALAQKDEGQGAQIIEPETGVQPSETVTINVKDANISEVLKAYSLQTGQSIVVGPDVVSDNVNVRLNDRPWNEALDVILKPYGFGYREVGGTIVISKLENIVSVEGIEPLGSKVFTLKYLDAYDIKEVCEAQLSARGKFTILPTKGLPGWEFGGSDKGSGAATEGGIRNRRQGDKEQIQKSKTFVITDVPAVLTGLAAIIESMDKIPEQVLIEARFMEIKTGNGSQIGLDYISAIENIVPNALVSSGGGGSGQLTPIALPPLNKVLTTTTGFPDPLQTGAAGTLSQKNGVRLSSVELGGQGYEMVFNMIANNSDANVLSAPKLLTLNNQEAAILVGQKYPIIESQSNTGGGGSTTSTSLDYYENIGIQLNVIPQICDNAYISMIVHPAVSEIERLVSGITTSDSGTQSGTSYPLLNIREAETQVMIRSGNTAVIGGLQTETDSETIEKIPFLGDIPFIGRLFRNETLQKEKKDLLIFVKATIVENEGYAAESLEKQKAAETAMGIGQEAAATETEPAVAEPTKAETAAVAPAPAAKVEAATDEEKEELVNFVAGMSPADAKQVEKP